MTLSYKVIKTRKERLSQAKIIFPIELPYGLIGEAINVNELGLHLRFREEIPSRIDTISLDLIVQSTIEPRSKNG